MMSRYRIVRSVIKTATLAALVACGSTPRHADGVAPAVQAQEPQPPTAGATPPMTRVPGAMFLMGASDGMPNERPIHSVQVGAFEIDTHEVTVREYAACVGAAVCTAAWTTVDGPKISEKQREIRSQFCNGNRSDRQDHPVNCVDSIQATTYCAWLGRRLPTEEEWEYAARGTDNRMFPWGNDAPSEKLLNGCADECVAVLKQHGQIWEGIYAGNDGFALTAPVGSYPAGRSPFGVLDMAGNVSEWTNSFASRDYSGDRENSYRIHRGGGWDAYGVQFVRASHRSEAAPLERDYALGFRCAK